MTLLKEQLISRLVLAGTNTKLTLRVELDPTVPLLQRAVGACAHGDPRLRVSTTEIAYWLRFFLTYLRDGYGDVDHLDVEAETHEEPGHTIDVTLAVARTGTPLTVEEAKRQLGL